MKPRGGGGCAGNEEAILNAWIGEAGSWGGWKLGRLGVSGSFLVRGTVAMNRESTSYCGGKEKSEGTLGLGTRLIN